MLPQTADDSAAGGPEKIRRKPKLPAGRGAFRRFVR